MTQTNVAQAQAKKARKVVRCYRALTIEDVVPARYLESAETREKCLADVMNYQSAHVPGHAREMVRGFLRDCIVDGDPLGYLPLIDYAREIGADVLAGIVINTLARPCRAILAKSRSKKARELTKAYAEGDTDDYRDDVAINSAIIAEYVSRCKKSPQTVAPDGAGANAE